MFYWPDQKRRLWYISRRISTGSLNRSDICNAFGISTPQASADISKWLALNPGAAVYDKSTKRYVPN